MTATALRFKGVIEDGWREEGKDKRWEERERKKSWTRIQGDNETRGAGIEEDKSFYGGDKKKKKMEQRYTI